MPEGNIVRGLFRLARGDAGGVSEFGNTTRAFSASIAPLLAFPIVGAALFGIAGHWMLAGLMLASRICGVLLQPVITEFGARRANSSATWLMTSTALNWSVWLVFPLILIGILITNGLITLGLSEPTAVGVSFASILLYMFWIQWFILRTGLRLSVLGALTLLIAMNVAIAVVYIAPYVLHPELITLTLHPDAK